MKTHGKTWYGYASEGRNGFKRVLAKNRNYTTESIAVPTDLLLAAITDAMVIRWGQVAA